MFLRVRLSLLLICLLLWVSGVCQPVLDSTYFPQAGIAYKCAMLLIGGITIQAQEGLNQTWDYSNLQSGSAFEFNYTNSYPGNYVPNPRMGPYQIAVDTYNFRTGFYRKDAQGLSWMGSAGLDGSMIMHTPFCILPTPFAFGDERYDTVSYLDIYNSGLEVKHGQHSRMKYVGTGSLSVPGGITYSNLVQVRRIDTVFQDSASGWTRIIDNYLWLNPNGTGQAVAAISHHTELLHPGEEYYSFTYITEIATHAGTRLSSSFTLSPSPAQTYLQVSHPIEVVSTGRIFDLSGRYMMSIPANQSSSTIDISHLRPGLYFLTLDTPQGPVTKRFVKE